MHQNGPQKIIRRGSLGLRLCPRMTASLSDLGWRDLINTDMTMKVKQHHVPYQNNNGIDALVITDEEEYGDDTTYQLLPNYS